MKSKRDIVKEIKNLFSLVNEIESLYIYGSFLRKDYDAKKSDVDILIILKDSNKDNDVIEEIKKKCNGIKSFKYDVNIVFKSEFKYRFHIYRPPTYYLGIKLSNKLLIGKDLLQSFNKDEVSAKFIYKRAVDLAQSSRSIYINSKNPSFWERKYIKWLRVLTLEVLYLHGYFELNFKKGLKKLQKIDPKFIFLDSLLKNRLSIHEINFICERLKTYLYLNFILRN